MKLTAAEVERTLSQFEAQPIPDDHLVLPQLNSLFGDHTFFLDRNGLNIVEPTELPQPNVQAGRVINLATGRSGSDQPGAARARADRRHRRGSATSTDAGSAGRARPCGMRRACRITKSHPVRAPQNLCGGTGLPSMLNDLRVELIERLLRPGQELLRDRDRRRFLTLGFRRKGPLSVFPVFCQVVFEFFHETFAGFPVFVCVELHSRLTRGHSYKPPRASTWLMKTV